MPSLFFAGIARELIVLHAISAVVLAGASTHHAVISLGFLRSWVFDVRPAALAIDFYGRCVLASTISTLVGGVSYVIAGRLVHRERIGSTITVLTALTLIVVFVVMAFLAWRVSHVVFAAIVAGGS